jgi:hypothetical protein
LQITQINSIVIIQRTKSVNIRRHTPQGLVTIFPPRASIRAFSIQSCRSCYARLYLCQRPIYKIQDEPCDVPSDTTVVCKTPEIDPSKDRNQTIRVHFDGLTTEISVNYVDDPAFDVFHGILEYDKESTIQIMVNTR